MSVNKSKATFEIEQCWFFAVLWRPFWKWRPVEIFRCRESIQDTIIYLHMKFRWNRTMLNLCGIVAPILKMATSRKFSMSGHHYLLTRDWEGHAQLVLSSRLWPVIYAPSKFWLIIWLFHVSIKVVFYFMSWFCHCLHSSLISL